MIENAPRKGTWFRRLRWIVPGLAVTLSAWAFWLEPASLRNETHTLRLPTWPAACDGLRVAVLADLHVGAPYSGPSKLEDVVELTARARPDVVLLAGDYVIHGVLGGRFVPPEATAGILARLVAPGGVYAVLGNHDRWFDGPRVQRALEDVAVPVLEDSARRIEVGGCRVWLVGVSDAWTGAHDIAGALSQVPAGQTILLFTHNPDIFPQVPDRVALTVAGHTHGGQVFLPGLGRPVVPSEFGQRFAIGHVVESGRHLFVSSGVGTSILPIRFLVPPEVSVLQLHAASR